MNNLRRVALAFGMVAMSFAGVLQVRADELIGIFQTWDGAQDYEVSLCGNGKQLCGKLVALHGTTAAGDTEYNRTFLGKYIVEKINPTGKNVWRGPITINKNTVNGSATLIPGKELVLYGCAYIVMCGEFRMRQIQ
jgi:uncharacterized protein (DUF2147 family)